MVETAPAKNGFLSVARLCVLLSGGALAAMLQMVILPSLTQIAAHFSGQGGGMFDGATIAQLVMTIAAATLMVGAPLIGWLAPLVGKRNILLASALLYAIAGVAGAVAPDIWTLFASRLVLGLATGGFSTVAIAFISDYYSGERRDRLIGWYAFLGSGGALIALPIGSELAKLDWRAPFALYLIGLPLFALALPTIRETKPEVAAGQAARRGSMRNAYGLFALIFTLSLVLYMYSVQGPFLFAADGIPSPSTETTIILEIATLGSMLSAYLFGHLRPRLGFLPILVLTWGVLGLGSLGAGLVGGFVGLCVFAGLSGFGSGFMSPLTQTAILNVVPPQAITRALGFGFGLIFLALFLQPVLLAPVRTAIGIHGTFIWVGAVAIGVGALTALWGMRPARKPRPA